MLSDLNRFFAPADCCIPFLRSLSGYLHVADGVLNSLSLGLERPGNRRLNRLLGVRASGPIPTLSTLIELAIEHGNIRRHPVIIQPSRTLASVRDDWRGSDRPDTTRGIYDNMKTAVEAIFVGKARRYNGRFLQMCSHHLIEPVACTPASGWEKAQVENQVGNLRDQLFRPKPRVKSLTELNAWLEDQCVAYARRTQHPEFKDRTIWDVFQEERASLMELRGPFDGFVEQAVRASTTCLIMADHNRYSVDAWAAGRTVLVRSHAEPIVVLLGDEVVADHPRHFRRAEMVHFGRTGGLNSIRGRGSSISAHPQFLIKSMTTPGRLKSRP